MEPLVATDWLKDYDPLFDLFDEEMRAGQVASTSDYFIEYDLNNYYNPYKQTDELSLILGLEWMPCFELNSPTASNSSSSAPSPATSSSSAPSPATSSSSSSSVTSSSSSAALSQAAAAATLSSIAPSSATSLASNSQSSTSSNIVNTPTSAPKKRKKCQRTKGTSLLAQPSPKLSSTCSSSLTRSPVATPLSILLPINSNNNNKSSSSLSSASQVLPTNTIITTSCTNAGTTTTIKLDKAMRYCVKIEHAYSC